MNIKFRNFFLFASLIMLNYSIVLKGSNNSSTSSIVTILSDEENSDDTINQSTNYYNNGDLIKESERQQVDAQKTVLQKNVIPSWPQEQNLIFPIPQKHPNISPAIAIPNREVKFNNSPEPEEEDSSPEKIALNAKDYLNDNHQRSLLTTTLKNIPTTIQTTIQAPSRQRKNQISLDNRPLSSSSSSSESSSFDDIIASTCTRFFIIPNVLIYSFLSQIHKIGNADEKNKKKLFETLQEAFIWRTVGKINTNDSIRYSLDTFIKQSISINDLYAEHKELFLKNENPIFIKGFLTNGLSLEIQNDLFQQVFNQNSLGYLNATLARTLILYGYTLELLENYRNQREHHKNEKTVTPSVGQLFKSNIANLTKLSQELRSFNPCIQEDGISQELKAIIHKKIICLVRNYNIEINKLHRSALFAGNKINAKKFFSMPLNDIKSHTYQTMTLRALARYDKIQS